MICALTTCNKKFERNSKQKHKIYCSNACGDKASRNKHRKTNLTSEIPCGLGTCKNKFTQPLGQVRRKYCSVACSNIAAKISIDAWNLRVKQGIKTCALRSCRKEFKQLHSRIYCSDKCKKEAIKIKGSIYIKEFLSAESKTKIKRLCQGVICDGKRYFMASSVYETRCNNCKIAVRNMPDNYSVGIGGRTCRS